MKFLPLEDLEDWDSVGATWSKLDDQALWRHHSDAVNLKLLARWLPNGQSELFVEDGCFR